jgi:hypothetical protein
LIVEGFQMVKKLNNKNPPKFGGFLVVGFWLIVVG